MVRLIPIAIILLSVAPADAQRDGRRDWRHDRPAQWHRDKHRDHGSDFGGFIGGVIGGIIRGQQPDPVEECARRFRSYNPETGYYRGYDGYLRRCP